MKCPACKLENPPRALRCDCGYTFAAASSTEQSVVTDPAALNHLRSIDDSLRSIRRILIACLILTLLVIILFAVRSLMNDIPPRVPERPAPTEKR